MAEGEEGYYVVDYVSEYLQNQGYSIVEEAWKLVLRRVQSEPDCVSVGIAAYYRKRSDIAERAWVTGVAYSSYVCAQQSGHSADRAEPAGGGGESLPRGDPAQSPVRERALQSGHSAESAGPSGGGDVVKSCVSGTGRILVK